MYRCVNCGNLFEEGEQKRIRENMGECHGAPSYIDYYVCPVCEGDYEEVKPCTVCGSYRHDASRLLCEDCENKVKEEFRKMACNLNDEEKKYLIEMFENGEIL